MTLIKLAALGPMIPGPGTGFATTLAMSGNPAKYMAKKNIGKWYQNFGARRKVQKASLATFANAVKEIRTGKVADSTRLMGGFVDAQTGHMLNLGVLTAEDVMRDKRMQGVVSRKILNDIITEEGKYNIPKIESYLKLMNNTNKVLTAAERHNLPLYSAGLVGGASALKSSLNQDNEGHHLSSAIKAGIEGAIVGGGLGYKAKDLIKKVKYNTPIQYAPILNETYFADNYWKSQLQGANTPLYQTVGKIGAKLSTGTTAARAARIARFDALSDFGNIDLFNTSKAEVAQKGKAAYKAFLKPWTTSRTPTVADQLPVQDGFREKIVEMLANRLTRV